MLRHHNLFYVNNCIINYLRWEGMCLVVFVCLSVCLSVQPSDYLKSNERILPKVCLGLRNNRLDFVDDSDHDPDPETDYDPDQTD